MSNNLHLALVVFLTAACARLAVAADPTEKDCLPILGGMKIPNGIPTVHITAEEISAGELLPHLQASLHLVPHQPAQFRVIAADLHQMMIPLRPFEAALEQARIPYAHVKFFDDKTGEEYFFAIQGTSPLPAPNLPSPEVGRQLVLPLLTGSLENELGFFDSTALQIKMGQWPSQVQDRFWQLAGLFANRVSNPVMINAYSSGLSRVLIPMLPERNIQKIWDLFVDIQQFFEPISPTTVFRRINGTFEQAARYHQENPLPAKGLARTNPVRVQVPGTDYWILVPQVVRNKLDGWIRLASHELTTETRGVFTYKKLPHGDLLITDFIPQPGFSESLLRPSGYKTVKSEYGTMQTLDLNKLGTKIDGVGSGVLFVFGIQADPELLIPIPHDSISVHSHFLSTPYQGYPSDADHVMFAGKIAAVRTPKGGLIFYGHAPLEELNKPFTLIPDPMLKLPIR